MSYLDEYDLERSRELEHRLDRDEEREPYAFRGQRPRCRPRYSAGAVFPRAANTNECVAEREAA